MNKLQHLYKTIQQAFREFHPLGLSFVGPFFLLVSLAIFCMQISLTVALTMFLLSGFLLLIPFLQKKGIMLGSGALLIFLGISLFTRMQEGVILSLALYCVWILGLWVSYLGFVEGKEFFAKKIETLTQKIEEKETNFQKAQEERQKNAAAYEQEINKLKEETHTKEENLEKFQDLIEASDHLAKKAEKDTEKLYEELLRSHRKLMEITHTCQQLEAKVETLESDEHAKKKLLNQLNELRLDNYQQKVLTESQTQKLHEYETELQHLKEKYETTVSGETQYADQLSQAERKIRQLQTQLQESRLRKEAEEQTTLASIEEKMEIKQLEEKRFEIKGKYEALTEEYKELKSQLEELIRKKETLPEEEVDPNSLEEEFLHIKQLLEEKKMQCNDIKQELIDLERELFVMKKQLQEEGKSFLA